MVETSLVYYSLIFIFSLFIINRMLEARTAIKEERADIKHTYLLLCVFFVLWSVNLVAIGISDIVVLDKAFMLIVEFSKICTFVFAAELCASITDRMITKKKLSYKISSRLLYLGVFVLAFRVLYDRVQITKSYFGDTFVLSIYSVIFNTFFYTCVIFFMGAYTYMYYYSCNTKRERYISKNCTQIVAILAISLTIETIGYVLLDFFIPSMYIGMIICYFKLRNLIFYKRSIEYNEVDYDHILSSAHPKPAFVCDYDGRVLFENTRAFVMRQTYKDKFVGRLLTEIFEITEYDKERLKEPRNTQVFDIYCKYPKEPKEMLLNVKHNLDKFGAIFSTEVEVGYASATNNEQIVVKNMHSMGDLSNNEVLSSEKVRELRIKGLIHQLEVQKKLYLDGNRTLFIYNLKGISKAASVLSLTALEELCDRINTELKYGEWESLEPMMIDIDRQYETLEMLNL